MWKQYEDLKTFIRGSFWLFEGYYDSRKDESYEGITEWRILSDVPTLRVHFRSIPKVFITTRHTSNITEVLDLDSSGVYIWNFPRPRPADEIFSECNIQVKGSAFPATWSDTIIPALYSTIKSNIEFIANNSIKKETVHKAEKRKRTRKVRTEILPVINASTNLNEASNEPELDLK